VAAAVECDIGEPAATLRLFNGHDHLQEPSLAAGEVALATLSAEGVSAGLLALGTPDSADLVISLGLQASSAYPVFAFVNPPAVIVAGGEKAFDATTLAFVQAQLDAGVVGIGEVSLRHSGPPALAANIAADDLGAQALYAEAAARSVPITIHFETRDKLAPGADVESRIEELRSALAAHSNTVFIWAHLGDTGPETVRALIEEFDNLYADLSSRNPYFARGWPVGLQSLSEGAAGTGNLKLAWKNLFEDHSDRFLFGLDLASEVRWAQMPDVVAYYRSVLGQLSAGAAEKIACENARALLAAPAVPGPGAAGLALLALAILAAALVALIRPKGQLETLPS
jgi:predicted TIM-barrel fold metal-dependent hydrolase